MDIRRRYYAVPRYSSDGQVHWVNFLDVANPHRSHLPRAASPTLEDLLGRITTATPRFTLVTVNYDHPITPELRRQICSTPSIRMFYGQNLMKDGTKCNAKIQPLPLGLNTHKCVGLALLLFFRTPARYQSTQRRTCRVFATRCGGRCF